jgi:hypothetical protein
MSPDLNDTAALIRECRRLREQSRRLIDDTAFFCDLARSTLDECRRWAVGRHRPTPGERPSGMSGPAHFATLTPSGEGRRG